MRQEETRLAEELIRTHLFYVSKNTPMNADDYTISLYHDDVFDMYHLALDYESRLLELQKLFEREIKSTGKSYGVRSSGVLDRQALLDAITIRSQSWKK